MTYILKLEYFLPKHQKLYKISISKTSSCNWKIFPVNTNTLNKKSRASNLYWTRLTLSIHGNSRVQCSTCRVLQQGNFLFNLKTLPHIIFLHSLCKNSAEINSQIVQSPLVHIYVREFLCTDCIWIESWYFPPS